MSREHSIAFFDRQFSLQDEKQDFELNPFEIEALPHLSGRILDFGCGLGNLSIAAGQKGCRVLAVDASPAAISSLQRRVAENDLPIEARQADLRTYQITDNYDCVVSIGLLSFLDCTTAIRVLDMLQDSVRPGGIAIINSLIAGTTWIGMFNAADCCLLARNELHDRFSGWTVLQSDFRDFPAPGATVKSFVTLTARKPAGEF